MKKFIENFFNLLNNLINKFTMVPPILSGGVALSLYAELVKSTSLSDVKFGFATVCLSIMFISSVWLFAFLRKVEKDKDLELLRFVARVVNDVFKEYGGRMAENDASQAKPEQMNSVMQTIVNLTKEFSKLAEKKYSD